MLNLSEDTAGTGALLHERTIYLFFLKTKNNTSKFSSLSNNTSKFSSLSISSLLCAAQLKYHPRRLLAAARALFSSCSHLLLSDLFCFSLRLALFLIVDLKDSLIRHFPQELLQYKLNLSEDTAGTGESMPPCGSKRHVTATLKQAWVRNMGQPSLTLFSSSSSFTLYVRSANSCSCIHWKTSGKV